MTEKKSDLDLERFMIVDHMFESHGCFETVEEARAHARDRAKSETFESGDTINIYQLVEYIEQPVPTYRDIRHYPTGLVVKERGANERDAEE